MRVAPCTGARIEIRPRTSKKHTGVSHPARVRESKLNGCSLTAESKGSHPVRVRESKPLSARSQIHAPNVAPCAGARIEITLDEISAEMAARRTSRGCANRNLVANAICVDEPPLSHPARVCESKPLDDRTKTTGVMSHAARVRESKCLIQLYRLINDPSHLMRVRESK